MKPILKSILLALVLLPTARATPPAPPYLHAQAIGGLWPGPGLPLTFTFTGQTVTNGGLASNVVLHVACDETDLYATPAFAAGGINWTLTGSLIVAGTNLQVAVSFSSDSASNALGGAALVLTNFNAATNTLYLWQSGTGLDATLTGQSLTSPSLPAWDAYGAAFNATNGWPWRIYRSSTWSLAALTNGLNPGDFVLASSNGQALIGLWLTNGVPVIKQLLP
jgi:hypothetical protein